MTEVVPVLMGVVGAYIQSLSPGEPEELAGKETFPA